MSIRRSLLVLGLLGTSAWLPAAPPLTRLLDEKTAFVISVQRVPELLKNWEVSPWARTWRDPEVVKFFAPLRRRLKLEEWDGRMRAATGCTVRELLALAGGEALVAVPDFDFLSAAVTSRKPPLLVAVEFGSQASAVEKLIAGRAARAKDPEIVEEFQGATLHVFAQEGGGGKGGGEAHWSMADGVLLIATSRELLQQTIMNLRRGGAAAALTTAEGFVEARRRAPDAQVFFYASGQAISSALAKLLDRWKPPGSPAQNPFVPDPAMILRALGFDALGVLSLTINLGEEATEATGVLTFTGERGLVKLLSGMTGEAPRPRFISPKWPLVSSGRFSVKSAYETIEEILRNASPPLEGLLQGQILNFNRQLGLDLKRDLLGSLGDEMISACVSRGDGDPDAAGSGPMEQFYAFSLNNRQAFENAIEALKRQFGGEAVFARRDYLGTTIHTLGMPASASPASGGFSYAIARRYLFVSFGSAAPIETAIQGLGGEHPSFWDEPAVQAAFASLPSGASSLVYHDLKKLVPAAFDLLARLPWPPPGAPLPEQAGVGGSDAAKERLVDPSAKPSPGVLAGYWGCGVGASYHERNAFLSRYRVIYPH